MSIQISFLLGVLKSRIWRLALCCGKARINSYIEFADGVKLSELKHSSFANQ